MEILLSQGPQNIPGKLYRNQTLEYFSGLHMSSKSFTGVLEDRDVLDEAGDGVKVLNISQRSFTESFIKNKNIRKFVKTPHILQVTSWSLGGKGCS